MEINVLKMLFNSSSLSSEEAMKALISRRRTMTMTLKLRLFDICIQ